MPAEFSLLHRVQFCETDMAGIVHFANYFNMMEEVEHAFFRSLGFSISMQHEGLHIGWPRVSVSCEFTSPVKFEDELELKLRVVRVGDKSLSYEVQFNLAGQEVARGKSTSVCCAMETGKLRPVAIPAALKAKLIS
jgi:acyl-CoA thioester hydrolase